MSNRTNSEAIIGVFVKKVVKLFNKPKVEYCVKHDYVLLPVHML